jgi:hypothetical protein
MSWLPYQKLGEDESMFDDDGDDERENENELMPVDRGVCSCHLIQSKVVWPDKHRDGALSLSVQIPDGSLALLI